MISSNIKCTNFTDCFNVIFNVRFLVVGFGVLAIIINPNEYVFVLYLLSLCTYFYMKIPFDILSFLLLSKSFATTKKIVAIVNHIYNITSREAIVRGLLKNQEVAFD